MQSLKYSLLLALMFWLTLTLLLLRRDVRRIENYLMEQSKACIDFSKY